MDSDRRSRRPRPASIDPERRALIQRLVTVIWDDIKDVPLGRQTVDTRSYDSDDAGHFNEGLSSPHVRETFRKPSVPEAADAPRRMDANERGIVAWIQAWREEHRQAFAVFLFFVATVVAVLLVLLQQVVLRTILGVAFVGAASLFLWMLWDVPGSRRVVFPLGVGATVVSAIVIWWLVTTQSTSPEIASHSIPAVPQNSSSDNSISGIKPAKEVDNRPAQPGPAAVQGHAVLNVSTAKLLRLCSGYTSLQCDNLFSEYAGKWIQVRGSVSDVGEGAAVVHVPDRNNTELGYNTVIVYFDPSQREEVVHLRAKDDIVVLGKIGDTAMGILDLQDADLVRNNTANARTP